jgi:hypothetical protein
MLVCNAFSNSRGEITSVRDVLCPPQALLGFKLSINIFYRIEPDNILGLFAQNPQAMILQSGFCGSQYSSIRSSYTILLCDYLPSEYIYTFVPWDLLGDRQRPHASDNVFFPLQQVLYKGFLSGFSHHTFGRSMDFPLGFRSSKFSLSAWHYS